MTSWCSTIVTRLALQLLTMLIPLPYAPNLLAPHTKSIDIMGSQSNRDR
jgi:hypothetical protein